VEVGHEEDRSSGIFFTQTTRVEVSGSDIARFEVGGSKGIPSFRAAQG